MFTGIVENIVSVSQLTRDRDHLHLILEIPFGYKLKINQSLAHNGVCLTVVDVRYNSYITTAISESLQLSTLGALKVGDKVNIERAIIVGYPLNGHIVQGHIDLKACIKSITLQSGGSWLFILKHDSAAIIKKGAIAVNGVSLTVVESDPKTFSVKIIPFTYVNTNLHLLRKGEIVNIEFDIQGKYLIKHS